MEDPIMNKALKTLLFLIAVFSIGACSPPINPNPAAQPERDVRTEEEYEERKRRDEDRNDIIQRERDRYSGQTCEELDRGDDRRAKDDCEEKCEDMYFTRGDRHDCEELEVSFIEDLFEVYENLKDADDLEDISINLFEAYLNISISGLEKVINRYSSKESEDFLIWLIDNTDALRIFEKEDRGYEALESLFQQFDSDYNEDTLYTTFTERLDGNELMQIAIFNRDKTALEWFMDYINDKNPACDGDQETKDCFEIYCKIGAEIDRDARDEWLKFEEFENYIDDIIDERVNSRNADSGDRDKYNSSGWRYGRTYIQDLNDVDDWVDELCHDLR